MTRAEHTAICRGIEAGLDLKRSERECPEPLRSTSRTAWLLAFERARQARVHLALDIQREWKADGLGPTEAE